MGKLIKIATFQNSLDAHFAKGLLEAEGLQSYLEGEHGNLALSYVGSAIGGVRLMVDEAEREAATDILNREEPAAARGEDWLCQKCFETVDAGFDVCWNCEADRPQSSVS